MDASCFEALNLETIGASCFEAFILETMHLELWSSYDSYLLFYYPA